MMDILDAMIVATQGSRDSLAPHATLEADIIATSPFPRGIHKDIDLPDDDGEPGAP